MCCATRPDTAVFAGSILDYTITMQPGPRWVLTKGMGRGPPDIDTLFSVEKLKFDDALIDLRVNNAPIARDDSATFEDKQGGFNSGAASVLDNDFDFEHNPLSATAGVFVGTFGTLTLNANGTYAYVLNGGPGPGSGQTVQDTFAYTVSDGKLTDTANLVFNIIGTNDAPVAAEDSYVVDEDQVLTITAPGVLLNDTDTENDPLTAVLVDGPANGDLTLNADGSFSYTPDENFNGLDSFTYKANDGSSNGNTVTVNLTVNPVADAPASTADSYGTDEDTPLSVAAVEGVLANDADPDGDPLTAVLVSGPAHAASFALNPDGSFSYTPTSNFNGPDSFTYKASDGTLTGNTVTVSLGVTPVNDAPEALADAYKAGGDTTLTILAAAGVLSNDTDVDNDPLSAVLVGDVSHGKLTLGADGGFSYTPSVGYTGPDSFTYKPNDGTGDGNTVTVSLTVTPPNAAPVGKGDGYQFNEDTTLDVNAAAGVLANDTDADGDPLTAILVGGPAHAAAFTFNADGSFKYTPAANFNGPDSFTYKPNDGLSDGATVTVNLNVFPVNDPLDAKDDVGATDEVTPLVVSAANGVLSNDIEVDGVAPVVTAVQGGTVGTQFSLPSGALLTLNADGSYVYDPNGKFDALQAGQTANDTFTYTARGSSITDTATVTITVSGAIELPAVTLDSRNPTFFPDNQSVDLFANVVALTDADAIDQLIITISNVTQGANERLILDGTTVELTNGNSETTGGPLGVGVSVVLSDKTATITITPPAGFDGTELASLIDGMHYENVSADPGILRRAVTLVSVSDTGSPNQRALNLSSTASPSTVNEIVSVSTDGVQGNANSATGSGAAFTSELISSLSGDGRFVAFASTATTLIGGDTNGLSDVFLRDRLDGETIRVSVADNEAQANGSSTEASVSDDGNLVVFTSFATNLVAGDPVDTSPGVYLRNISAGTTVRLNLGAAAGDDVNGARHAVISGDGKFVAFNTATDVFVHEVATGTTTRVSAGPGGVGGGGLAPDISTNGRWVVFTSGAPDLVAGDTNGLTDVFLHDRNTGVTTRVSLTDGDAQATGGGSSEASVSDDGNIIVFVSTATNLVASDPNGAVADIFVRNVALGTTVRIPTPPGVPFPNGASSNPSVSGDGRYVAFSQSSQVWVYDVQTGELAPQAITTIGSIGGATRPYISSDGGTVVFQSGFNNLITTDANAAGIQDVFASPVTFNPGPSLIDLAPSVTFDQADVNTVGQILDPDINLTMLLGGWVTGINAGRMVVSGLLPEDVVSLKSEGSITVTGTGGVLFNGLAIGQSGGGVGEDFFIRLNSNVTTAALEAVVEHLTYKNTNTDPGTVTETRTLHANLVNALALQTGFSGLDSFGAEVTGASNPFAGIDVGDNAAPVFADIDKDGDLDLVVGAADGTIHSYRKNADGTYTALTGAADPFQGADVGTNAKVAFVDKDRATLPQEDGDLDAYVGSGDGTIHYFRNVAGVFTEVTGFGNALDGVDLGDNAAPAADTFSSVGLGPRDLAVGFSTAAPTFSAQYMVNNASLGWSQPIGAGNKFNFVNLAGSSPIFADLDGDGDGDLIVGTASGELFAYRQNLSNLIIGSSTFSATATNPFAGIDVGTNAAPSFVDFDGDGDKDLVVGAADGTLRLFENTTVPRGQPIVVNVTPEGSSLLAFSTQGLSGPDTAGWDGLVDTTPNGTSEHPGLGLGRAAAPGLADHAHVDTLTAILHELAQRDGLGHDSGEASGWMDEFVIPGQGRLPELQDGLSAPLGDGLIGLLNLRAAFDAFL